MLKTSVLVALCCLVLVETAVPPKELEELELRELLEEKIAEKRMRGGFSLLQVLSAMYQLQIENNEMLTAVLAILEAEAEEEDSGDDDSESGSDSDESESESGSENESGSESESGSGSESESEGSSGPGSSSDDGSDSSSSSGQSSGSGKRKLHMLSRWMKELEYIKKMANSLEHDKFD